MEWQKCIVRLHYLGYEEAEGNLQSVIMQAVQPRNLSFSRNTVHLIGLTKSSDKFKNMGDQKRSLGCMLNLKLKYTVKWEAAVKNDTRLPMICQLTAPKTTSAIRFWCDLQDIGHCQSGSDALDLFPLRLGACHQSGPIKDINSDPPDYMLVALWLWANVRSI